MIGDRYQGLELILHKQPKGSECAMKVIQPHEIEIFGRWVASEDHVVADEACQRIADLTDGHLVELGRDSSGWEALYRDPNDGRLWELTYPQGELQGGGPTHLRCLSADAAKQKYGDVVSQKSGKGSAA